MCINFDKFTLAKNTKYNCCIVYDGNNGEVYGLVELDYAEYTPPAGKTLTNNGIREPLKIDSQS